MANQVSSGINPYLEDLYREIEKMHEPPKGWCDIPHCRHCELAEQKIQAAKDAAARAYSVAEYEGQIDDGVLDDAYRQGVRDGLNKGRKEATAIAHRWANDAAHRAAQAAKNHWYQRGLQDGRASASSQVQQVKVDDAAMRKKFFEEALEDCRVIGESNPQMQPAANALRHRLKKRIR